MRDDVIETIYSHDNMFRYEIVDRSNGTFKIRTQKRLYDEHLDTGYIWIDMHDYVHITDTFERAAELGDEAIRNLVDSIERQNERRKKWCVETYSGDLTPYQQYNKILQAAGWYEGRVADVKAYEEVAKAKDIPYTNAMQYFLQEFGELNAVVYVTVKRNDRDNLNDYDFTFNTSVKEALELSESEEYEEICFFAKEKTLCCGEIGSYYPAVCAIGESGKLYSKHDYSDSIEVYNSMFELVTYEQKHDTIVHISDTYRLSL